MGALAFGFADAALRLSFFVLPGSPGNLPDRLSPEPSAGYTATTARSRSAGDMTLQAAALHGGVGFAGGRCRAIEMSIT